MSKKVVIKNTSLAEQKSLIPNIKFFVLSLLILCTAYFVLAFNTNQNSFLATLSNIYTVSKQDISTKNEVKMASSSEDWKKATSIYEFSAQDIEGNDVQLSKYKGRVALIVNVACSCGLTSGNYPEMQELYKKYEPEGLSVLAFPCNQFGGQEPKPEAEIKEFIKQYNVQFDMFSKINVNGDGAHPLYKYLKSKVDGTFGSFIKWNFSKFLINREGVPVKRYSPTTKPLDIEKDIVNLLNTNSKV